MPSVGPLGADEGRTAGAGRPDVAGKSARGGGAVRRKGGWWVPGGGGRSGQRGVGRGGGVRAADEGPRELQESTGDLRRAGRPPPAAPALATRLFRARGAPGPRAPWPCPLRCPAGGAW